MRTYGRVISVFVPSFSSHRCSFLLMPYLSTSSLPSFPYYISPHYLFLFSFSSLFSFIVFLTASLLSIHHPLLLSFTLLIAPLLCTTGRLDRSVPSFDHTPEQGPRPQGSVLQIQPSQSHKSSRNSSYLPYRHLLPR